MPIDYEIVRIDGDALADGHASTSRGSEASLDEMIKQQIWKMYEENMGAISHGTSLHMPPEEKQQELFDPSTIYFLAFSKTPGGAAAPESSASATGQSSAQPEWTKPSKNDSHSAIRGDLLGFATCRFDVEDTVQTLEGSSEEKRDVVYLYELQVSSRCRGQGIGRKLLDRVERLAIDQAKRKSECTEVDVSTTVPPGGEKDGGADQGQVLLTCLKRNAAALSFYARAGYEPDDIDPTRYAAVAARRKVLARLARARQQSKSAARGRGGKTKPTMAGPTHSRDKDEDAVDTNWVKGEDDGANEEDGSDYRILSKKIARSAFPQ